MQIAHFFRQSSRILTGGTVLLLCSCLSYSVTDSFAQFSPPSTNTNRTSTRDATSLGASIGNNDNAMDLPTLGDEASSDLSPAAERKIGLQAMQQIRQDSDFIDDALVRDYLNNFAYQLLSAARVSDIGLGISDFELFGVRDASINAFAMPGGFIGVHTGLILAAQSESELASVLAHECGHVLQRHIARRIGVQKQASPIAIAALLLAVLAARSNPDAVIGTAMAGQGFALQKQLNFSRDAEREADRVGFQLLKDAGFDTNAMPTFFLRMQNATRAYDSAAPAYLRTHPLTTERIADIENRARSFKPKAYSDTPEFWLLKARSRVLQSTGNQGLIDSRAYFDNQLKKNSTNLEELSTRYGLALLDLQENKLSSLRDSLPVLLTRFKTLTRRSSPFLEDLLIGQAIAENHADDAIKLAENARRQFPLSRALSHDYAQALMKANRQIEASAFLRDQTQLYRNENQLWQMLAETYDLQGKRALQMAASAESALIKGQTINAVQLLENARRINDADFYDMSIIESRYKEIKNLVKEEMEDRNNRRPFSLQKHGTTGEHVH